MDCVFCRIALKREKAWLVYEDDEVMVFLDKYPMSYGHVLIAPKRHYTDITDTPPELVARIFIIARALGVASLRYLGATGFRILTNKGSSAGQVIFHFHVHLVPRYGHGDPGPIEPRETINDRTASEVVERYRKALSDPELLEYLAGKR